jgi:hypothetical protein
VRGLNGGGIGVEAIIRQQKHFWLEACRLLNGHRFRREIALHHRLLVGEEGSRVEGVGLCLLFPETMLGSHPLVERGEAFLGHEDIVGFLQIGEGVKTLAGVRDQHLRLLLEAGGNRNRGNVLLHRREGLQHIAAHVEIDAADGQQHAVVGLRTTGRDGHIKAKLPVGAIGHSLIKPAMLGLRQPVGAKNDLFGGLCAGGNCDGGCG